MQLPRANYTAAAQAPKPRRNRHTTSQAPEHGWGWKRYRPRLAPLTRVRVGLERARQNARTLEDLRAAVDQAIGLGLSLVNAIVKLHGFRFSISPGPGCVAEIAGQRAHAGEKGSAHGSDEQI